MPLMLVRNAERGPNIWAKKDRDTIIWGPAGTANDTRRVPDWLLEDPDFLEACDAGSLVIEQASAEIDARMAEFSTWSKERRAQREQDATAMLDRRQDRQILAETCVGPGPNGRTTGCTATVQRPAKEKDQTPPLCPQHTGLVNEYVLDVEGSAEHGDDGTPAASRWTRFSLG